MGRITCMNDTNNYANERLLDFMDASHTVISRVLQREFGADWLDRGVRKHCGSEYFDRAAKMLRSPMRVVEMGKTDDEVYGIEHLWPIISGNWSLFKPLFQDRSRTEACLGEIKELRHNLSHRRKRHHLSRPELIRIMGSCQMILSAFGSPRVEYFSETVESLCSGGTPWGAPLDGRIPPKDEMYSEFVGRPSELNELSEWFESDNPQVLVWGYGGVGKSALAYKFARDVRESSSGDLMAVCWVSAKKYEYFEGETRSRPADFKDLNTFHKALWRALYGDSDIPQDLGTDTVIKELNDIPILLVVDDFDTVSEDFDLSTFLLHDLRGTAAKTIFTSRQRQPAIVTLEVPPFHDEELKSFLMQKSLDYGVDQNDVIERLGTITKVTGGYPLFIDDLVHHAAFFGVKEALSHWTQRKGDAARQYALRRQIEYLSNSSGSSRDVLIALAAANRALRIVEISAIAGLTDDDAEAGVRELLKWRLVTQVLDKDGDTPGFRMNNNTTRLVRQTFSRDPRTMTYVHAFKALTGERVPEAMRSAIGRIVNKVNSLLNNGDFRTAEEHLLESMKGDLANSADLHGVLGWLYSRHPAKRYAASAQMAFQTAHRMGASKIDTYYHWANLEREIAENMIETKYEASITDDAIAAQWKKHEDAATKGIERCGPSQLLYYSAGYGASREANAKARAGSFSYAEAAYRRAVDWFEKALTAPVSDFATIHTGMIYRGMVQAYEGVEDFDALKQIMKLWRASSGSDVYIEQECRRLLQTHSQLRNSPELMAMLR